MTKVKQAVIMVGGQGTRLMPFTKHRPKPALPVLNKPCLRYLLESMAEAGIEEVILACGTGYKTQPLKEAIGDGSDLGITIEYSYEEKPLGTGGAMKQVIDKLDEVFVAANGDVFADISLNEQITAHFSSKADVTIALTEVKDEDRPKYGIAIIEADGRIIEFKEKPKVNETASNLANAGIYVINKDVLSIIDKNEFDFSKDLVPRMMEEQKRIQGFMLKGMWRDVGRPGDLLDVNLDMATKLSAQMNWDKRVKSSIIKRPFFLGEDAYVTGSNVSSAVILNDTKVVNSTLTKAMIMRNCVIMSATIKNSIIGTGCTICPGAEIIDSDIEDGRTVGADKKIVGERVKKE
jgi:mannose-1-phosphate guanylyltransferase